MQSSKVLLFLVIFIVIIMVVVFLVIAVVAPGIPLPRDDGNG
jgi:hypothetical protein